MDSHEVFTEENLFSKHMYEQHPDKTDTLKRPAIVALYERPLQRATSACDFCALEETRALSATRLRRHLARHLEELALCVLQGSNSEKNYDSTGDGDSDADDKYFEKPGSRVNIDADKERSNAGPTVESQHDRISTDDYLCAAQQHSVFDRLVQDSCLTGFGEDVYDNQNNSRENCGENTINAHA